MRKILILSDSHGLKNELKEIIERHKAEVDCMIHCGDSELEEYNDVLEGLVVVQGNCDWNGKFEEEHVVNLGSEKIYVTHGHRYNVKTSYVPISYRAEEVGATIACFGHSHVATTFFENDVVYINPGSIKTPRGRKEKTYVICEILDKEINVFFYERDGNLIKGLEKKFIRN